MRIFQHWRRAVLPLVLALCAAVPARADGSGSIADFRIAASDTDFLQQAIAVQYFRPDAQGKLQPGESAQIACALNRVTGDASFYIQPKTGGVWVTVDFLTDLNGDGVYELPEVGDSPAQYCLVPGEDLSLAPAGQRAFLSAGRTYLLSAGTLSQAAQEEAKSRAQAENSLSLGLNWEEGLQTYPLCLVQLYQGEAAQPAQSYYLKLYGQALMPDDVSPGAPYYQAVEYVLSQGYLSGFSGGEFQPDALFTRAQLAQTLWRMGGSLMSTGCRFSDVAPGDWYYDSVSWCCQNGLMAGLSSTRFEPGGVLSRQQLAQILYQYASRTGRISQKSPDVLGLFSDGAQVAPWAREAMSWAAVNNLFAVSAGGALRPGDGVTRSQVAQVLYRFDLAFPLG